MPAPTSFNACVDIGFEFASGHRRISISGMRSSVGFGVAFEFGLYAAGFDDADVDYEDELLLPYNLSAVWGRATE